MKKKKIVLVLIIILLGIITGIYGTKAINTKSTNKYDKFIDSYESNLKDGRYAEALSSLNSANEISRVDGYSEKRSECEMLKTSLSSYKSGERAVELKNYDLAIMEFKNVNEKDKERYELAQQKIKEIIPKNIEKIKKDNEELKAQQEMQQRTEEFQKEMKKMRGITIGMSQQDVLDSIWGQPEDINKTTTKYGVSEQWVYSGYRYIYFDNGIVTAIQE